MKRLFGWVLAGAGAVGVLWGGYHISRGMSDARYGPVTAFNGGLAGVAALTLGLIWVRD